MGICSVKKKAAEVVYVRIRACLPLTSQNSYRVERATGNETEKLPPFSDPRLTVARSEQCCEQRVKECQVTSDIISDGQHHQGSARLGSAAS